MLVSGGPLEHDDALDVTGAEPIEPASRVYVGGDAIDDVEWLRVSEKGADAPYADEESPLGRTDDVKSGDTAVQQLFHLGHRPMVPLFGGQRGDSSGLFPNLSVVGGFGRDR
jgi:hypothetical protein